MGLGLAVARGFVETIDGELDIEDTPGGGCTMVIRLPAPAADGDADTDPGTTPDADTGPGTTPHADTGLQPEDAT